MQIFMECFKTIKSLEYSTLSYPNVVSWVTVSILDNPSSMELWSLLDDFATTAE